MVVAVLRAWGIAMYRECEKSRPVSYSDHYCMYQRHGYQREHLSQPRARNPVLVGLRHTAVELPLLLSSRQQRYWSGARCSSVRRRRPRQGYRVRDVTDEWDALFPTLVSDSGISRPRQTVIDLDKVCAFFF